MTRDIRTLTLGEILGEVPEPMHFRDTPEGRRTILTINGAEYDVTDLLERPEREQRP